MEIRRANKDIRFGDRVYAFYNGPYNFELYTTNDLDMWIFAITESCISNEKASTYCCGYLIHKTGLECFLSNLHRKISEWNSLQPLIDSNCDIESATEFCELLAGVYNENGFEYKIQFAKRLVSDDNEVICQILFLPKHDSNKLYWITADEEEVRELFLQLVDKYKQQYFK